MAKRQQKNVRKRPAKSAPAHDDNVPSASIFLRNAKHPLDTIDDCRREVQELHHEISMHHSWETAERIFKSLPAAASFRKRFREEHLRSSYELLRLQNPEWGRGRAALHLFEVFQKSSPGE